MVWEVPNRAPKPEKDCLIDLDDVEAVCAHWTNTQTRWAVDDLPELFNAVIWHTHPNGLIGPSNIDLENRIEGIQMLVVTLPGGEAVRY